MKRLSFQALVVTLPVILVLHTIGCYHRTYNSQLQELEQMMNSLVGVLTYDQALMKFGGPQNITEGLDIYTVTWLIVLGTGSRIGGTKMALSFSKATHRMVGWSQTIIGSNGRTDMIGGP